MKILITGRTGQVGSAVIRELRDRADVLATGRGDLDLTRCDHIRTFLHETDPDLVINAAAFTAVDDAEEDPDTALAVNARAVKTLGEEASRLSIGVVHYSTDYVFDGARDDRYVEDDAAAPLNVYGRTKRLGEVAMAASGASHVTFRVGWVYSARPGNFLTTMLRLMSERESLRVVSDEIGTPTWNRDIARATVAALEALAGPVERWNRAALTAGLQSRGGLYHLAPSGETSWHGFASEILARAEERGWSPLRAREIEPIPADEWPSAARRPGNTLLDVERLAAATGVRLPEWREGVAGCMDEIVAASMVGARRKPAREPAPGRPPLASHAAERRS